MSRALALAAAILAGCGPTGGPAGPAAPTAAEQAAAREREAAAERERRAKLAAAHRGLEDEQATALAATCEQRPPAAPRCLPSCYAREPADPRAGKQLARPAELTHLVCTRGDAGPYLLADEVRGAALELRAQRGRVPKAAKPGSWQADVEAAAALALKPVLGRGDVVRVIGTWKPATHPVTQERLRCVPVSHFAKAVKRPLDACGATGAIACEAAGNDAAHGLNVVRYRLLEAKRLHAAGKDAACQQAALEAVAVARGMPRWRQYMTLNTDRWKASPRYRTRFDGTLDEDALFATAISLGTEAQSVHTACGGPGNPKTTVQQEQSFHTCW